MTLEIKTSATLATGAAAFLIIAALFLGLPTQVESDVGPAQEQIAATSTESHAAKIADAIYQVEGRCTLKGQSGEYGCYQYLPSTWRAYSTTVAGKVLPQTHDNERAVTVGMISLWLAEGISDRGIFLTWNQGSAVGWGPGKKDCYKGVNSHGVAYDSCSYAARALVFLAATTTPQE